jgi:hypothetical protein
MTAAATVQHNDFGPLSFQVIFNDAFIRHLRQHNIHESQSLNNFKVNTFYLRAFNNDHSSLGSISIESTQGKNHWTFGHDTKFCFDKHLKHSIHLNSCATSRSSSSYHKQLCYGFVQNCAVLKRVSLKITAFWDVMLSGLENISRRFE